MKLSLLALISSCTGFTAFIYGQKGEKPLKCVVKHSINKCPHSQKPVQSCMPQYNELKYTFDIELGTPLHRVELLIDMEYSDSFVISRAYSGPYLDRSRRNLFDPSASRTFINNHTEYTAFSRDFDFLSGYAGQDVARIEGAVIDGLNFAVMNHGGSDGKNVGGVAGMGVICKKTYFPILDEHEESTSLPWQLKELGYISHASYSLWLNSWTQTFGSLVFGGYDGSLIQGSMYTFPIVESMSGLKDRFALLVTEMFLVSTDGSQQRFYNGAFPIVFDSRTAISSLPLRSSYPFFRALGVDLGGYRNYYTDKYTSTDLTVPCSLLTKGGGIGLLINGVEIIFPFSEISAPYDSTYTECVPGVLVRPEAVLGANFLQTLYVIYDLENLEIGIALACTLDVASEFEPAITSITVRIPGHKAPQYSKTDISVARTLYPVTFHTRQVVEDDDVTTPAVVLGDARGGCQTRNCAFMVST